MRQVLSKFDQQFIVEVVSCCDFRHVLRLHRCTVQADIGGDHQHPQAPLDGISTSYVNLVLRECVCVCV